jgi:dihydropteroate synthase
MKVPQDSKKMLNAGGVLLDLSTPIVMGILNITPDSFFDGSRYRASSAELLQKAGEMLEAGAAILDVGGYSTRPGADDISESEEKDRVLPVIEALCKAFPKALISVDTFRSGVAREAARSGARMINDVSGGNLDEAMFETVAELRLPYVLMHMRGTPKTMTQLTTYTHLVQDIRQELLSKLTRLRCLGVADVLIDPGFGFAKTVPQNFELLRNLTHFHSLNAPLLIGLSRKSLIWRTLGVTAGEALNGTTVLNTLALAQGAHILRVHDVKEAVEAIKLHNFVADTR